jgi:hypothetical protein
MRPTPSRERERAVAGLPGLLCIQAHGRRRLSRQRIAHQRETAATAGGFHFVQDIVRRQADQALGVRHAGGARAGKDVYPLPTMVNVWNGGYGTNDNWERFDRPGETYPSGGAVSHMLDLWKANAPAIDAIASDIYHQSPITYLKILNNYRRPDNPPLIVETGRGIAAGHGRGGGGLSSFQVRDSGDCGVAGHPAFEGGRRGNRNWSPQSGFPKLRSTGSLQSLRACAGRDNRPASRGRRLRAVRSRDDCRTWWGRVPRHGFRFFGRMAAGPGGRITRRLSSWR